MIHLVDLIMEQLHCQDMSTRLVLKNLKVWKEPVWTKMKKKK